MKKFILILLILYSACEASGQLSIVPNPVTTTLDIRGMQKNSADEISIFNIFGEKVFSAFNCKLPITVPIAIGSQLPSGMYSIEITSGEKIYREKFVKQ
jgi:hypothetical protein